MFYICAFKKCIARILKDPLDIEEEFQSRQFLQDMKLEYLFEYLIIHKDNRQRARDTFFNEIRCKASLYPNVVSPSLILLYFKYI